QERQEVRDGEDGRRGRGGRLLTPAVPSHAHAPRSSGRPDSNRRPLDPQSSALTKLRHGPDGLIVPARPLPLGSPREPARRTCGAWPGTADGWALLRMRTPGGADSPGTAGTRRAGLWRRTGRTSAAPSSPACRTGTVAL